MLQGSLENPGKSDKSIGLNFHQLETIVACDSHVVTVFLEEVILNFHLSETRIVQFSHVVCWTKIIWVITEENVITSFLQTFSPTDPVESGEKIKI